LAIFGDARYSFKRARKPWIDRAKSQVGIQGRKKNGKKGGTVSFASTMLYARAAGGSRSVSQRFAVESRTTNTGKRGKSGLKRVLQLLPGPPGFRGQTSVSVGNNSAQEVRGGKESDPRNTFLKSGLQKQDAREKRILANDRQGSCDNRDRKYRRGGTENV